MEKKYLAFFIFLTIAYFYDDENEIIRIQDYGKPLSVMTAKSDGGLDVKTLALENLFLHPEVKDRKPVIISILGDFRKGKSFLLDYFLRFMYSNVSFSSFHV